ncbi:hypothetical protein Tco_0115916 [Tanacetum coccineum]
MLLKSNIYQDEDCILGLLTFALAKKIIELIKKDELTIADLEGVRLAMLKRQYKNYVELDYHDDTKKDFFKAEMGNMSSYKVKRTYNKEYEFSYADLARLRLNDVEDMYLLKVQEKLHHLKLDFEIDFINALLL